MADDGTVGNIFIPSFLIGKTDGDSIKKYLKKDEFKNKVVFSLKFEMAHPDNRVEYEIWMISDNV